MLSRGTALPKEKQAKAIITLWSSLKSHFGCSYKEIAEEQFTEALSLAARVAIDGEFIGKDDSHLVSQLSYQVLCRIEKGKQVEIKMFDSNRTVDDVEVWMSRMERQGAKFLFSDQEKMAFVRDQLSKFLN